MSTEKNETNGHVKTRLKRATRTCRATHPVAPEDDMIDGEHEEHVCWMAELKSMCHGSLHRAIFDNREVVIQFAADGNDVDIDDLSQVRGTVYSLDPDEVVVLMRNGKSARIDLDWIADVFHVRLPGTMSRVAIGIVLAAIPTVPPSSGRTDFRARSSNMRMCRERVELRGNLRSPVSGAACGAIARKRATASSHSFHAFEVER